MRRTPKCKSGARLLWVGRVAAKPRRCHAPPEVPSLGYHLPSVSRSRYLRRPKFVLFAERTKAHGKLRKSQEKHQLPKNGRINTLIMRTKLKNWRDQRIIHAMKCIDPHYSEIGVFPCFCADIRALACAPQPARKSGVSNPGARKQREKGRPRDGIFGTSGGARQDRG